MQELKHALSHECADHEVGAPWNQLLLEVQTRKLWTKALISASIADQCSYSLTMSVVATSPRWPPRPQCAATQMRTSSSSSPSAMYILPFLIIHISLPKLMRVNTSVRRWRRPHFHSISPEFLTSSWQERRRGSSFRQTNPCLVFVSAHISSASDFPFHWKFTASRRSPLCQKRGHGFTPPLLKSAGVTVGIT